MDRRLVILFTAGVMLWVLAVPASSLAGGAYPVKNTSGHKVGSVNGVFAGKVWNASGSVVALTEWQDNEGGFIMRPATYAVFGYAERGSGSSFLVRTMSTNTWQGRVVKSSGHYWILQRRVSGSWHRRGTVAGGSSGLTAAAAFRRLLWN